MLHRHVRRLWALPRTALGLAQSPARGATRLFGPWNYWWQAHLLDCAVDAFGRSPSAERRRRTVSLVRGVRLRNAGRWRNNYFDDMAWLGLALQRAGAVVGVRRPDAVGELTSTLIHAWRDDSDGGIPWRVGDEFRNAPANGPAALLLARTGHTEAGQRSAEWLQTRLVDRCSGLVLDGLRPGLGLERAVYTYNQGTVLGLETELADGGAAVHAERVHRLVAAVEASLTTQDVLHTHGGGDGGLFSGILARYLAVVANTLPGTTAADDQARTTATRLVLSSARSVWVHREQTPVGPVFSADWARSASGPEADLSVQLGAWMLLEAAAAVCAPAGRSSAP